MLWIKWICPVRTLANLAHWLSWGYRRHCKAWIPWLTEDLHAHTELVAGKWGPAKSWTNLARIYFNPNFSGEIFQLGPQTLYSPALSFGFITILQFQILPFRKVLDVFLLSLFLYCIPVKLMWIHANSLLTSYFEYMCIFGPIVSRWISNIFNIHLIDIYTCTNALYRELPCVSSSFVYLCSWNSFM